MVNRPTEEETPPMFPATTDHMRSVSAKMAKLKRPDASTLTVQELACVLYEGMPALSNLAETLARTHGRAEALTFFDMMGEHVQNFWTSLAQQMIEHSRHWDPNMGSACNLGPEEYKRLQHLPRAIGDQHTDGQRLMQAVDQFATELKRRLIEKLDEGETGWDGVNPNKEGEIVSSDGLIDDAAADLELVARNEKEIDIAARMMFLWHRRQVGLNEIV